MKTGTSQGVLQSLPKPAGNLRWNAVIWMVVGGIINYFDRANLSIAAPEMMRELHLTNTDIGLLGTVFGWTYAFCQLPSGWLVDRFGAKKVYSIGIIWWSVATAMTGLCTKVSQLMVARSLLAIGEAPCWPSAAKITANWFPKKERGFATGFWDSSSKWGPTIAPPILVGFMLNFGWQSLFYITGAMGIIYAFFFVIFYKSPEDSKTLSKEELAYIKADNEGTEQNLAEANIKWSSLFKYKSVWGMILGFFCTLWIWNIFLNFLPLYLVKTQGVSIQKLGIYASIPWLGGALGAITGGYINKLLVDKGMITSPLVAKKMVIVVCSILAAISVIAIPYVHGLPMTITVLTLSLCFVSAVSSSAWALPGDVAPPALVASVGAIQNFGGYFGGAWAPTVAGMIVDATGSYELAFVSGGIIAAGAAFCYWFLVKEPIKTSLQG
jgi:sugar phosphate permease